MHGASQDRPVKRISALVRLAPEAYSGSLKSTHPSLPYVWAAAGGGEQMERKRSEQEFVFAPTFWPAVAGLSTLQIFLQYA